MKKEEFLKTSTKFGNSQHDLPSKRIRASVKLPSVKGPFQDTGNYVFGQLLGQGGYGKVRLCTRKKETEQYVVKTFQKFKLITEDKKKAILKQVEIMKCIKHPSIINIIDFYQTKETINIVMEYFSIFSLSDFTKTHRPLPDSTIRSIVKQTAEAIAYLHKMKIAHRDIKPENILINDQHQIKIIDLGLSLMGNQTETKVAGTPFYMSPELLHKKKYDPFKADIWAFGILLYWLVLGYFPQDSCSPRKKRTSKSFQLHFPLDMHPGIQYLISKMLQEDPEERVTAEQILLDTWVQPKDFKNEISKLLKNSAK